MMVGFPPPAAITSTITLAAAAASPLYLSVSFLHPLRRIWTKSCSKFIELFLYFPLVGLTHVFPSNCNSVLASVNVLLADAAISVLFLYIGFYVQFSYS